MLKLLKISIGGGIVAFGLGSISLVIYAIGESDDMLRWGLSLAVIGLGGVLLGIGLAARWHARALTSLTKSVSSLRSLTERVATKGDIKPALDDLDAGLEEVVQGLSQLVAEVNGQNSLTEAMATDLRQMTADHPRLMSKIDAISYSLDGLTATSAGAERVSEVRDRRAINHVSALFYLHAALHPGQPLPTLGGWALAADACAFIVNRVLTRRPETILELGSGSSTVLLALATDRADGGRIVCIDHDPVYLEKTRSALQDRGLEDRVELVLAPLEEIEVEDVKTLWYGIPEGKLPEAIDLVIVDGPPMAEGSSRFPALPLIKPRLTRHGALILDDSNREKEVQVIVKWREAHPDMSFLMLGDYEKGVAVFERSR